MSVLEMKHIQKSFGEFEVLKDISLEVNKGDVLSIIGPSGSGKSTLVNDILCKALRAKIYRSRELPGKHKREWHSNICT